MHTYSLKMASYMLLEQAVSQGASYLFPLDRYICLASYMKRSS